MKKSTNTSGAQKPSTIKWAKGLAIFQLSVGALACVFFFWLFASSPTDAFLLGMQEGVASGFGKSVSYLQSAEGMGYLFGMFAAGLAAPVLALVAISRRSKNWTIASLAIYVAGFVSSISPVSLAVIILMLVKQSRAYLGFEK